MKPKISKVERPNIETLRRGRHVSPAEHARYSHALHEKYGADRPRLGRPPLGPHKAQDIHLRIPPAILKRLRSKAAKLGIGYQTLIKQILSRAA